jgi:hypothetical protein
VNYIRLFLVGIALLGTAGCFWEGDGGGRGGGGYREGGGYHGGGEHHYDERR